MMKQKALHWEKCQSPILQALSNWFLQTFSFEILNFQFSRLPNRTKYRLDVIIEQTKDFEKMYTEPFQPNQKYQKQIADEFKRLALKYRVTDESTLSDFFVFYNNFSDEARTAANWNAAREVENHIKSNYSVVWEVLAMFWSSVVFYHKDSDIATFAAE